MLFVLIYYLACSLLLTIYPIYIYPFGTSTNLFSAIPILKIIGISFPFRIFFLLRTKQKIIDSIKAKPITKMNLAIYNIVDFFIWTLIGISIHFMLENEFNEFLRYKLLLGCFSFGIFGSILTYLINQKSVINSMIESNVTALSINVNKGSFHFRILRLQLITTLTVSCVIVMMILFNIMQAAQMNIPITTEMHLNFLKEISFGIFALVFMAIVTAKLFADNTRLILNKKLSVMDEIVQGRLDKLLPVLSDDELGIMAMRINEMIKGLREKDLCRMRFGMYMTPEISELILKDGINPEGELVEATILFCDLRGYSGFAEKKSPHEVVKFLNNYFTKMEEAVKGNGGIILQFIGDEIEAVFGVPKGLKEHPEKAVRCALEMRRRLSELNKTREEQGEDLVYHGIGIHTGKVLAGNIGSPTRKSYVMVGDTVNLAARLQELNKEYGSDIIISEDCKNRLKDTYQFRDLGEVKVKGRESPVKIYAIL